MTVPFIRALFILLCAVIGHQLGPVFFTAQAGAAASLWGLAAGGAAAAAVVFLERSLVRVSLAGLSAVVFGSLLALIVAKITNQAIEALQPDLKWADTLKLTIVLILCYLGVVLAIRGRDEFKIVVPYVKFQGQTLAESPFLLDTSVIIDGRILDVIRTKFIEGRCVVPAFVLKELQALADSSDDLKRARGRRGLDILGKLRADPAAALTIDERDFEGIPDADSKLVKLGRVMNARILTNDFNLNKVAELQGAVILNVNQLAEALRRVLVPGERLEVSLSREGKERDQAVAYLDDGTMVVVEKGKARIGSTLPVIVTSVIKTVSGQMIFARIEDGR